jgi:PAS domain S-box-containing protein
MNKNDVLVENRVDATSEVRREAALLKTGALQNAILNSANFSSIATDEKGVIQLFNVGAERMLGYRAIEVVDKITPADISDPQEVIARAKALSDELATAITPGFEALVFKASRGIEDIYELTYIRKDGSRFPAVVSVTALRDDLGAIIGYLLIGTDNTARKRAEEALLKAGALQNAIFTSVHFSCIATDEKGVIQLFNVGAERMLGYTAAEVMNKITPAILHDSKEVIARATTLSLEFSTPIAAGFETLAFKASRGIEDIYELTKVRKDGSRFPAIVSVTALRNDLGGIIGYLLIGTDNTARKQAEAELVEQTRLLQCVLDGMGDGVIAADMNGKFLLFNPAAKKMLGIGALEATVKQWSQQYGIFLPDMATPYPASDLPLARALLGESVDGEELFIRNANLPEGVWLSATARPLTDEGRMWGGVVVFSDFTERKRERALRAAKEDAENANKAKNEFLSRMSHELRTPLNAIIGFSQVLEMTETSEKNRPRIGHILKAGRHLLGLIEEVLDISRIEARLLTLSLEPVSVGEAIDQAVDLVNPIAANAGVRLESTVSAANALYVSADRQRTQQILLNLLSNAIKYNSTGGAVTISAEVVSGKMRVNVTDTGIGIAEDFFPRLFQPFERLGATQTAVEGTGLGLALSKGLAEAMGGTIGVKSVVGQGTTFWLELSHAESPSRPLLSQSARISERPIQNDSSLTVLYIEDNLSNIRLMEDILAVRSGIKLITAMQGRIGLELAREHRPEFIFLDLHLPDMPGHEVLARLKSDPRTRTIPVVVISADATPGQVKRLLDAGVQEYLTKPIDMKHIFRVFDKHLSQPDAKPKETVVLESQSI